MSSRADQVDGATTAWPIALFELPTNPAPAASALTALARQTVPASIDLMSAARLLGIGRTCAYGLVRTGRWPTPVIRVGRCIRIPTRPLLDLLNLDLADIHKPPLDGSADDSAGRH